MIDDPGEPALPVLPAQPPKPAKSAEQAETTQVAGPLSLAFLGDPNSVHLRRWVGQYVGRGYRITLLVPRNLEVRPGYPPEVAIARFAPQTSWRPSQLGLLGAALSVRSVVRRIRPDVLHVHHLTVNGFCAWMAGFHPYVVTVWGSDVLIDTKRGRRARFLARLALRRADLVTGISRHVVNAAIDAGARPERSRVLHFGIDVERFSPGPAPAALRERLGLDGRRMVFSPRLIGRLYRQDVLVDALASLPEDVCLLMTRYGAEAAEAEAIERRIAARGLESRVRIVTAIPYEEMPDYYRLADVVATVAVSDAGPVTLVEALAAGRPVVCSDLPPVREWLAELDPESLVPVGDVEATASALRRVLDRDAGSARRIAERGRAAAVTRADERRTMAEMDRLYRELAARRPAGRLLESAR